MKLWKKNDGDRGMNLWRGLVKNSMLWWNFHDQKVKGLIKENISILSTRRSVIDCGLIVVRSGCC